MQSKIKALFIVNFFISRHKSHFHGEKLYIFFSHRFKSLLMISYNSINNCPTKIEDTKCCMTTTPCSTKPNNEKVNDRYNRCTGVYRSSNCYRPLQQLYKTVYSPMCDNRSSTMNFACICRPAERYKTTNMTYGSFHYNNWAYMQKNRPINYDRELFIQCYENTSKQQKLNSKGKCNSGVAE